MVGTAGAHPGDPRGGDGGPDGAGIGRAARRLVGVDVARGLALVFMMSVHIIDADATGLTGTVHDLGGGRASALFAVLAGVSLALVTGRQEPPSGVGLLQARVSVLGRAAVIGAVGLTLGLFRSGVAVILVNYAVLFAVACLFLGLRRRPLVGLAAAWLLLSPVAGHALRQVLPPGPGPVPSWFSLGTPPELIANLLLTGYYPVLQWTSYLLVGLAVGRSSVLSSSAAAARTAALWLVVVGALAASGAKLASSVLLDVAGGRSGLTIPATSPVAGRPLDEVLSGSLFGTTPTTSWWWLAVSGPHSGTPLDLLHTTGTALLVLGGCLLAVPLLQRSRAGAALVFPLASAGAMTLTLYCLHVLALAVMRQLPGGAVELAQAPGRVWVTHVVVALLVATLWRGTALRLGTRGRGPVEAVAAGVGRNLSEGLH